MFFKLLSLNWRIFLSNLNRFQVFLMLGYILFLGIMMVNLIGTALVVLWIDSDPWMTTQLPWLTPKINSFILLVFANTYWVMHFSFTNLRLLNIDDNRKLLGLGYPLKKLAKYLIIISFLHPVNIIYNLTWLIFLMLQIDYWYQIPVAFFGVIVNYILIYSIKHRFIHIVERRFFLVVISFLILIFCLFKLVEIISAEHISNIHKIIPEVEILNSILGWFPGGIMLSAVTIEYGVLKAISSTIVMLLLTGFMVYDHFKKTCINLLQPTQKKAEEVSSKLLKLLHHVLGKHAGKYYYYIMIHPYNKLQMLTVTLIPFVYVPLLLNVNFEIAQTVLIPTILAGIPVALLAMGMANMYGYEHREFLLHLQFPVHLEQQLKERFIGVIVLPLIVFYAITGIEILIIPQIGNPIHIYISNTFIFLWFMFLFLWSSYYQYQKATYSSFSYKHPIIPQKVTFAISFSIFTVGYLVFIPLHGLEWYRLTIMIVVIIAMCIYIWKHIGILATLFKKRILMRIWSEL